MDVLSRVFKSLLNAMIYGRENGYIHDPLEVPPAPKPQQARQR